MRWVEARSRLVPVVRPVTVPASALRAAAIDPARALVRQRLAPFLHVLLGLDLDDRTRFVSRGDLDGWAVNGDHAFALARDTLSPEVEVVHRDDGSLRLRADDAYLVSRLALPGWLEAFAPLVDGEPLAAAPHAGFLAVGAPRHARGLLLEAEVGWNQGGIPLSPVPLRRVGERLGPWVPAPGDALRARATAAVLRLAERCYRDQAEALADLGVEVLARYGLVADDTSGATSSVTAWTEGTRPLLPHADLVVLHARDGEEIWLPMTALWAAGLLRERADLDPPRLVPEHWPDDAAMKALRTAAIPARTA